VPDFTNHSRAAMIASGSPEHARRRKRSSHRNRQSAGHQARLPRQPTNQRANRACWQSRRLPRSVARTPKPRVFPSRRRRARSRGRNSPASAPCEIWHDGRPGRRGLRRCRRRDRADFAPGLTAIRFRDHSVGIGLRRSPQPEGRQSPRSDARQNEPHSSIQMSVREGRRLLSRPFGRLSRDALAKMPPLQR
jgi:hypothetical protein